MELSIAANICNRIITVHAARVSLPTFTPQNLDVFWDEPERLVVAETSRAPAVMEPNNEMELNIAANVCNRIVAVHTERVSHTPQNLDPFWDEPEGAELLVLAETNRAPAVMEPNNEMELNIAANVCNRIVAVHAERVSHTPQNLDLFCDPEIVDIDADSDIANKWKSQWLEREYFGGQLAINWLVKLNLPNLVGVAFCKICHVRLTYADAGVTTFIVHAQAKRHRTKYRARFGSATATATATAPARFQNKYHILREDAHGLYPLCDRHVRNKWKWEWLKESAPKRCAWLVKLDFAGSAGCLVCNLVLSYGTTGKKSLHTHEKSLLHIQAWKRSMGVNVCTRIVAVHTERVSLPTFTSQSLDLFWDEPETDAEFISEWESTNGSFCPLSVDDRRRLCAQIGLRVRKYVFLGSAKPYVSPPSKVAQIQGDGDCYFRAIAYILSGSENQHAKVREYIVRQLDTYESRLDLRGYIKASDMHLPATWASDPEIFVTAWALNVDVRVFCDFEPWNGVPKLDYHTFPANSKKLRGSCIYLDNRSAQHYNVIIAMTQRSNGTDEL